MNKNIFMISGCADNQYSHETVIEQDGVFKPQGALTYFLIQLLKEKKNFRWIDIVSFVQYRLKDNGYQQVREY